MGGFKFIRGNKSRKRWRCDKNTRLYVESPNKSIISSTRKRAQKTREQINSLDSSTKKKILEQKGIIRSDSAVPSDIVSLMLMGLV